MDSAPNQSMANCDQISHFVLIPMMAQGHMIPMVDMARLLAGRGALVSFITTRLNFARIQPTIDRLREKYGPLIEFVPLRFPCSEAGLPENCESVDALPSRDLMKNFIHAAAMLKDPLVSHLQHRPSPTCIISDVFHPWTQHVAREFRVPRLTFHGFGCFALLIRHLIHVDKILDGALDDDEIVVLPGLPHRIEITRAQASRNFNVIGLGEFGEEMIKAEAAADGVVVNSFDDLEPSYPELYQKAIGKKIWTIGPMWLCNKDIADIAARGNKADIDEDRCSRWLNSMKPSSVVYVSFGSLVRTTLSQLVEIGLALEGSNHAFIWVIKAGDKAKEVEEWLASKGFEERTRGRGLVIRGWAPQMAILSHWAVGGFVTHCGWNSTLEGAASGVPMATWPQFGEQFLNEKLVVEVLRVGVVVGVKRPVRWGMEEDGCLVKRGEIERALSRLMNDGEEGRERRERAREMGEIMATKAVEEGGSSDLNLTDLIEYSRQKV